MRPPWSGVRLGCPVSRWRRRWCPPVSCWGCSGCECSPWRWCWKMRWCAYETDGSFPPTALKEARRPINILLRLHEESMHQGNCDATVTKCLPCKKKIKKNQMNVIYWNVLHKDPWPKKKEHMQSNWTDRKTAMQQNRRTGSMLTEQTVLIQCESKYAD